MPHLTFNYFIFIITRVFTQYQQKKKDCHIRCWNVVSLDKMPDTFQVITDQYLAKVGF